jgi:hypothetical protein
MKNHYLALAYCLLACLSCEKEKVVLEPDSHTGKSTAIINGHFWNAKTLAYKNLQGLPVFNLQIDSTNEFNRIFEVISIANIPNKVGKHRLLKDDFLTQTDILSGTFLYTDADLILALYKVIETDSVHNFINITKLDTATNSITGTYELSLIAFDTSRVGYPDTINVRNGVFDVILKKIN